MSSNRFALLSKKNRRIEQNDKENPVLVCTEGLTSADDNQFAEEVPCSVVAGAHRPLKTLPTLFDTADTIRHSGNLFPLSSTRTNVMSVWKTCSSSDVSMSRR